MDPTWVQGFIVTLKGFQWSLAPRWGAIQPIAKKVSCGFINHSPFFNISVTFPIIWKKNSEKRLSI